MNAAATAAVIAASLCAAVWLGMRTRRALPERHLDAETRDAVKLAMGMIATMSALLLGLLVSSAKSSYDTVQSEVIHMAAKITFFDRVLRLYGPEADPLRAEFRTAAEMVFRRMWATDPEITAPDVRAGDALYVAIQGLTPRDETQRVLKVQASELAVDLAELRTLIHAQSIASISRPLLVVVAFWLIIIFYSFSLLAPLNLTSRAAYIVSALSVAGAIFLILEMDGPFSGLIQIPSQAMLNAVNQLAP
jgi:hypothetical protein